MKNSVSPDPVEPGDRRGSRYSDNHKDDIIPLIQDVVSDHVLLEETEDSANEVIEKIIDLDEDTDSAECGVSLLNDSGSVAEFEDFIPLQVRDEQAVPSDEVDMEELDEDPEIFRTGGYREVNLPDDSDYQLAYAGFCLRYIAFLVDWTIAVMSAGLLFKIVDINNFFLRTVLLVITLWLYYTLLESSKLQATMGKLLFNIYICDGAGKRISFRTANRRFWSKFLSCFMGVGCLTFMISDKNQALHDMIADSFVLEKVPDNRDGGGVKDNYLNLPGGSAMIIVGGLLLSVPVFMVSLSILSRSFINSAYYALLELLVFAIPGMLLIKWGLPIYLRQKREKIRQGISVYLP